MSKTELLLLLGIYASVTIPHIVEYFMWRKRFDAMFEDDRKEDA